LSPPSWKAVLTPSSSAMAAIFRGRDTTHFGNPESDEIDKTLRDERKRPTNPSSLRAGKRCIVVS
jgi:hypothetical protein